MLLEKLYSHYETMMNKTRRSLALQWNEKKNVDVTASQHRDG